MMEHNKTEARLRLACIGLSVLLHIMLFLALLVPEFWQILEHKKLPPKAQKPKIEAKTKVMLRLPQKLRKPLPKVASVPKTKPPVLSPVQLVPKKPPLKPKKTTSYARTSDDQTAGRNEQAQFQGERDTLAASNNKVISDAAQRPSIRGDQPDNLPTSTVDTSYQDGDLAHMQLGPKSEAQPLTEPQQKREKQEAQKAEKAQQEQLSSIKPSKETGRAFEEKEAQQRRDRLVKRELAEISVSKVQQELEAKKAMENAKRIAEEKLQEAKKRREEQLKKEKQKAQEARKKAAKIAREKRKQSAGFRSEARSKVQYGSISRRSQRASRNVKATPLGKYMGIVSKKVEIEWQRRCAQHADLIQPGILKIYFTVNEVGKVQNIRMVTSVAGSSTQKSLTFQALQSVRLPAMPAAVRKVQAGDPVEFVYTFQF